MVGYPKNFIPYEKIVQCQQPKNVSAGIGSGTVIAVVLVIFLLIVAGGIIVYFWKRRSSPEGYGYSYRSN